MERKETKNSLPDPQYFVKVCYICEVYTEYLQDVLGYHLTTEGADYC